MESRGRKRPNPAASPPASSPWSFPATSGYRLPLRADVCEELSEPGLALVLRRGTGCGTARGSRRPRVPAARHGIAPHRPQPRSYPRASRRRPLIGSVPDGAVHASDGCSRPCPEPAGPALPSQGEERSRDSAQAPFPSRGSRGDRDEFRVRKRSPLETTQRNELRRDVSAAGTGLRSLSHGRRAQPRGPAGGTETFPGQPPSSRGHLRPEPPHCARRPETSALRQRGGDLTFPITCKYSERFVHETLFLASIPTPGTSQPGDTAPLRAPQRRLRKERSAPGPPRPARGKRTPRLRPALRFLKRDNKNFIENPTVKETLRMSDGTGGARYRITLRTKQSSSHTARRGPRFSDVFATAVRNNNNKIKSRDSSRSLLTISDFTVGL